jgi:hypothetical protein
MQVRGSAMTIPYDGGGTAKNNMGNYYVNPATATASTALDDIGKAKLSDTGRSTMATQGEVVLIVTNIKTQAGSAFVSNAAPYSGAPAGSQGYIR